MQPNPPFKKEAFVHVMYESRGAFLVSPPCRYWSQPLSKFDQKFEPVHENQESKANKENQRNKVNKLNQVIQVIYSKYLKQTFIY